MAYYILTMNHSQVKGVIENDVPETRKFRAVSSSSQQLERILCSNQIIIDILKDLETERFCSLVYQIISLCLFYFSEELEGYYHALNDSIQLKFCKV